ncbi:hypothetical protein [Vulcanisaeta moutnovskia]|nr:hypothetical protein [Vulcanisaeta moutnovskia]
MWMWVVGVLRGLVDLFVRIRGCSWSGGLCGHVMGWVRNVLAWWGR